MNWFVAVIKKYAEFAGRARRKEYWMFVLFYILIAIGLSGGREPARQRRASSAASSASALLVPSIGGDRSAGCTTPTRSGWWILIGFVPLVGGIVLLVFMCLDGSSAQAGRSRSLIRQASGTRRASRRRAARAGLTVGRVGQPHVDRREGLGLRHLEQALARQLEHAR